MKIRAAVVRRRGGPFTVENVALGPPGPDEVLVRLGAAGICRTDLHIRDQNYPTPEFPVIAGHEGAGTVVELGADVSTLSVGDRVVISFPWCGGCMQCRHGRLPYCQHGFDLSFAGRRLDGTTAYSDERGNPVYGHIFQQSAFATHCVAPARSVVAVRTDLPFSTLAPLGCGIQTGSSLVFDALHIPAGSSVAVVGVGSVGLAAIAAAHTVDAGHLIAVDPNASRLKLAIEFGAHTTVGPNLDALAGQLLAQHRTGLDYIIDTTGSPEVLGGLAPAVAMTGTLALLGAAPAGATTSIDMNLLLNGRTLRGSIQGDADPRVAIPRLIRLIESGQFPLDRLIVEYPLDHIERAVSDMEDGTVVKPVLRLDDRANVKSSTRSYGAVNRECEYGE